MKNEIPDGYTRVTEPLKAFKNFEFVQKERMQEAQNLGNAVHNQCENYALGLLIDDSDAEVNEYLACFKKWFDTYVDKVLMTETRINNDKLLLSGQFDMIVRLKGQVDATLIDLKTSKANCKTWELQLGAYLFLTLNDQSTCAKLKELTGFPFIGNALTIRLRPHGQNALINEVRNLSQVKELYLSALELHNFMKLS